MNKKFYKKFTNNKSLQKKYIGNNLSETYFFLSYMQQYNQFQTK